MALMKRSAAERHPSLSEQCDAARAEAQQLAARVAELEGAAHTARVACDFDAADRADAEAAELRPAMARAQSRLSGLEAAELEVSAHRQRDEWQARLSELERVRDEMLADAQRYAADFRPALSAAKVSARLAEQAEHAALEAAMEAEGIRHSLGLIDWPDRHLSGVRRPALEASGHDRYWLQIKNDGEL